MRPIYRVAFTLLLVAPLTAPAFAAEPDAPHGRPEAKKSEQGALVEYYSVPDQHLLWVDENGLTERGKAVMAEIGAADDYGLRASDYALPKADGFNVADAE